MQRFASSLLAVAIGLAPAAGFAATDSGMDDDSSPQAGISLDLLSVTDFALNPTDDTWISVVQQIRAHPCYETVGEERDMCESEYGLTTDLRTMLSGTDFGGWLHSAMIQALCGGQTGLNRAACVAGIPTLNSSDVTRFQQQLNGSVTFDSIDAGADADVSASSNTQLFERAGTAPTTRQNALDIIQENEDNEGRTTPYERSVMLWQWCAGSHMGQSGCFHSFQRFVDDDSIDHDTIKAVIEANGRAAGRNDHRNMDSDDDGTDDSDE